MSYWCDNPQGHRREGERDYERGGRYGYKHQEYYGHGACDRHYREGFDEARREDERRQAQREERERVERQQERRRQEARMEEYQQQQEEEEYYRRQAEEEYYASLEAKQPTQRQTIAYDFPIVKRLSRKRYRHWCRQNKYPVNP